MPPLCKSPNTPSNTGEPQTPWYTTCGINTTINKINSDKEKWYGQESAKYMLNNQLDNMSEFQNSRQIWMVKLGTVCGWLWHTEWDINITQHRTAFYRSCLRSIVPRAPIPHNIYQKHSRDIVTELLITIVTFHSWPLLKTVIIYLGWYDCANLSSKSQVHFYQALILLYFTWSWCYQVQKASNYILSYCVKLSLDLHRLTEHMIFYQLWNLWLWFCNTCICNIQDFLILKHFRNIWPFQHWACNIKLTSTRL